MLSHEQVLKIERDTGLVPFLVGKTGEGKTQFVKEMAQKHNLKLKIFNLSACESVDLMGIPTVINGSTVWAKPSFFDCDILFFDEVDRVRDTSIKASLLSLFLDRSLNSHSFSGILIAAGNGDTGVNETVDFDDAMKERLVPIKFSYSTSQKISYLKSNYPQSSFVKYCEVRPEIFDRFTSRRIEKATKISDDLEILKVVLNSETASHYEMYLQQSLITMADIMSGESYDKSTSLTRLTVGYEIISNFKNLTKAKKSEIENLASFVKSMTAEEKSLYFTKIKDGLLDNSHTIDLLKDLSAIGLFAGQKEYLKELI